MGAGDESRKEAIRKRLRLARYPRRRAAVFSDENEHNPWVLEDCHSCQGRGTHCHERDGVASLEPCAACDGRGTSGDVVRYFDCEPSWPGVEVAVDAHGWVTCPRCQRRFSTRHRDTWTGRRHLTCGQALMLVAVPPSASGG